MNSIGNTGNYTVCYVPAPVLSSDRHIINSSDLYKSVSHHHFLILSPFIALSRLLGKQSINQLSYTVKTIYKKDDPKYSFFLHFRSVQHIRTTLELHSISFCMKIKPFSLWRELQYVFD